MTSIPDVSILVAARNESENIERCLHSLAQLDYPADKLEIWVGNDHSEDDTLQKVQAFCEKYPHFHCLNIEHTLEGLEGKTNVLAQLARRAKGSVYITTDADMSLGPGWVKGLLKGLDKNVGVVNGFTASRAVPGWYGFQGLDWSCALGVFDLLAKLGFPTAAMGNSMLITAEAYHAVGGFEKIPFSITEDFELFKQIVWKKKFGFRQLINKEVSAITEPSLTVKELLRQRKRWLYGSLQLPWYFQMYWLLVVLVAVGVFAFWCPLTALLIYGAVVAFKYALLCSVLERTRRRDLYPYLPLYEIYFVIMLVMVLFYFYGNQKIEWKGRQYNKGNFKNTM